MPAQGRRHGARLRGDRSRLPEAVCLELERLAHPAAEWPRLRNVAPKRQASRRVLDNVPGTRVDEPMDSVALSAGRQASP
jgi:hypothetical protein